MKRILLIFGIIGFLCGFILIFFTGGELAEYQIRPQDGAVLFLIMGSVFFTGYVIIKEIEKIKK